MRAMKLEYAVLNAFMNFANSELLYSEFRTIEASVERKRVTLRFFQLIVVRRMSTLSNLQVSPSKKLTRTFSVMIALMSEMSTLSSFFGLPNEILETGAFTFNFGFWAILLIIFLICSLLDLIALTVYFVEEISEIHGLTDVFYWVTYISEFPSQELESSLVDLEFLPSSETVSFSFLKLIISDE